MKHDPPSIAQRILAGDLSAIPQTGFELYSPAEWRREARTALDCEDDGELVVMARRERLWAWFCRDVEAAEIAEDHDFEDYAAKHSWMLDRPSPEMQRGLAIFAALQSARSQAEAEIGPIPLSYAYGEVPTREWLQRFDDRFKWRIAVERRVDELMKQTAA